MRATTCVRAASCFFWRWVASSRSLPTIQMGCGAKHRDTFTDTVLPNFGQAGWDRRLRLRDASCVACCVQRTERKQIYAHQPGGFPLKCLVVLNPLLFFYITRRFIDTLNNASYSVDPSTVPLCLRLSHGLGLTTVKLSVSRTRVRRGEGKKGRVSNRERKGLIGICFFSPRSRRLRLDEQGRFFFW